VSTETTTIEQVIAGWAGETGDLSYAIDDRTFSMSYGRAAVALLWAQDWLLYFESMADGSAPTA